MDSRFSFLIIVCLSFLGQPALADSSGVVLLDELIFDKVASRFAVTLLKLDKSYPYGEKHDQYTQFGKEQNVLTEDLLIADVHIKDYGEKDNFGLLKRFNIAYSDLPVILLLKKADLNKFTMYPADSDVTVYNLKTFVRRNTNLYIGLSGCLKDFDLMATDYMAKFNRNEFNELDKLIENAAHMIEGYDEKVKQMNKRNVFHINYLRRPLFHRNKEWPRFIYKLCGVSGRRECPSGRTKRREWPNY